MGRNLTNLYISQSFQFLTQISGSELQTGLGDTITGSLLITASRADNATSASQAISSSYSNVALSASYTLVSTSSSFAINATNAVSASVATSASFAVTASYALNAGATVSTGSLLVTASAVSNVITFTKGDGSTFPVTVATGSTVSSSFASTASLALLNVLTASNTNATITYTKGDGTTFTNVINNVVNATSASVATSASYAVSASQAQNAVSSSYAVSASQAQNAVSASYYGGSVVSASYAATSSYATNFNVAGTLTALSASITNLTVVYETSSVIYSSGSNQFGDASNDVQTLYGTVNVLTGPLNVSGAATFHNGITGSLAGTASYANNALSSSYAISASQAQNAVTASYALSASYAPGSNPFPFTGSAIISGSLVLTGSLLVTSSMILGTQQNDTVNPNGIIAGNNNLINGPSNVGFVFAGNSVMNNACDYAGIFGGLGHRAQFGYSQVFGGLYNYLGYNAPGAIGDVYGAAIVAGSDNTVNGNRTNNMLIVGGANNQIYTTNAASDFENNAIILGGRYNYISGSNNMLSAIVAGRNNLIGSNVSRSVILGGNAITASVSDTVYVPNLRATGSIITEGSTTSANPAMILASGSGRPLYFYAGGGINPTFDVESNQAIFNWVAGGTQTYQVMGLNNAWYFGYNYGTEPTVEFNANNYAKIYRGLQVSQSLGVTGSIDVLSGSFSGSVITNITDTYTTSPAIQKIITLTQAEYNAIGSPSADTLYIISGSVPFNPSGYATTGSNTFTGNQTINATASADVWMVDTKPFAQLSTDTIVAGRIDGADEDFILAGRNFNGTVPSITMTDGQFIYNESAHIFTGSVSLSSTLNVTGTTTLRDDVTITGSLRGNVGALSISSQTASLDCSTGNFFTLTLVSGSTTFVNPSNIQPGQTINLRVKQASVASGSISFASSVKQVSGSLYTPTTTANAEDIVTFIAFDSTNLYLSNIKNFV